MMPVVYISGPWRGANTELNTELAIQAACQLLFSGCAPICVHPLIGPAHKFGCTHEQGLVADDALIERCDAVLMLPGWETSEGCVFERERAFVYERAIYYSIDELVGELVGRNQEEVDGGC